MAALADEYSGVCMLDTRGGGHSLCWPALLGLLFVPIHSPPRSER